MPIPRFPQRLPIALDVRDELSPRLDLLTDGVSEFTFAGLYLFRDHYDYHVSETSDGYLILSGKRPDGSFFSLPEGLPRDDDELPALFEQHDYLKNLPPSWVASAKGRLVSLGFEIVPDRENFDYLYHASDLAELRGKRLHKKRNHVNAFLREYESTVRELDRENEHEAYTVLEAWRESRDDEADYREAAEALRERELLGLEGIVVYVDETPVAYAMGEPIGQSGMYVVHVEKALSGYRGLYQYLNKAFAERIAERYPVINREQDLGDPGLRQAKMTYRPYGFVEKHRVVAGVRRPVYAETDASPEAAVCCCCGSDS